MVRGLSPYPAAHTRIANTGGEVFTLKVFSGRRADDLMADGLTPGSVIATPKRLAVMCADAPYEITSLQLQGKRRMDTSAFLLGFKPADRIPEND